MYGSRDAAVLEKRDMTRGAAKPARGVLHAAQGPVQHTRTAPIAALYRTMAVAGTVRIAESVTLPSAISGSESQRTSGSPISRSSQLAKPHCALKMYDQVIPTISALVTAGR